MLTQTTISMTVQRHQIFYQIPLYRSKCMQLSQYKKKITSTNIPLSYQINFPFLDHCTLYLLSIYLCIYVYFIAYLYPSFLCEIKQKILMNRHRSDSFVHKDELFDINKQSSPLLPCSRSLSFKGRKLRNLHGVWNLNPVNSFS